MTENKNEAWENAPDKVKLAVYEWADKRNLSREQFNFLKNNNFRDCSVGSDHYYGFAYDNIFFGVELDGHIHT